MYLFIAFIAIGEYARAKVSFGLSKRLMEECGDLEGFSRLEVDLLELEIMEKEHPDKKAQLAGDYLCLFSDQVQSINV